MKKVLSYSLDHPDLVTTALQNVKLAKTIFPDWICRFYTSANIDTSELIGDNVEVVTGDEELPSCVWHFLVADDESVDAFLVQDIDDTFTEELYESAETWIDSNEVFFVIKSQEDFMVPVMPGKWGMKSDNKTKMKQTILRFSTRSIHITSDNLAMAFMWYYIIPLSTSNTYAYNEEL